MGDEPGAEMGFVGASDPAEFADGARLGAVLEGSLSEHVFVFMVTV